LEHSPLEADSYSASQEIARHCPLSWAICIQFTFAPLF